MEHMTPVLQELHWLPISARIIFKVLLLTYKDLHGFGPTFLTELLDVGNRVEHFIIIRWTRTGSTTNQAKGIWQGSPNF